MQAVGDKNAEKLQELLHPDFEYYTDGSFKLNKEKFIQFICADSWESGGFELAGILVLQPPSSDMALLRYSASFKGKRKGVEMAFSAIESTTFICENSRWQIVHTHTSNKM